MRMNHSNNSIAVHAIRTLQKIVWNSTEVLEQELNWNKNGIGTRIKLEQE